MQFVEKEIEVEEKLLISVLDEICLALLYVSNHRKQTLINLIFSQWSKSNIQSSTVIARSN